MLLLVSTSDKLQLVTSAAVTIDVHASWVDNSATAITPGRTNTAITTATTTDVVASPGASTVRNIKALNVRNKHATNSCDVTVQHTDGTTVAQLYKVTLLAGYSLQYIDGVGFVIRPPFSTGLLAIRTITASGVFAPTPGMVSSIVELVGGGGAGGGLTGQTSIVTMSAGGGAGGFSKARLTATQIGASQTITIGPGGTGVLQAAGNDGGVTSFGSLCIANGGKGGGAMPQVGTTPNGGAGGSITGAVGDFKTGGAPGGAGEYARGDCYVLGSGFGGSSLLGGGALAPSDVSGGTSWGITATNYGGGGSGCIAYNSGTGPGGDGAPGVVVVTEFGM
jgi:hypothetical protein